MRSHCTVREVVTTGKPYREILSLAAAESSDLIVMGVQGRGAVDRFFFGSTTSHVLREAHCPVLTLAVDVPRGWRCSLKFRHSRCNPIAVRWFCRPTPAEADMTNEVTAADVVVRDGSTVCLRLAGEGDVEALLEFFRSLSQESLYFRFMGLPALTASRVRALTGAEGGTATSIVAEAGGRIVAFAGFHRDPQLTGRAEVAFAVSDAVQGHGIGTRLLEHLANLARDRGISEFDAYVLGSNRRMFDVFRDSGFEVTSEFERGVGHVVLSLSLTERFEDLAAARSRAAATASMKAFFEPRVVAVVGANRERGKIGSEILHNLLAAGYTGSIVPVIRRRPNSKVLPPIGASSTFPDLSISR